MLIDILTKISKLVLIVSPCLKRSFDLLVNEQVRACRSVLGARGRVGWL